MKIHIDSDISDKHCDVIHGIMDNTNNYLYNPTHKSRYIRIQEKHIPADGMIEYVIYNKIHNIYVYLDVRKQICIG